MAEQKKSTRTKAAKSVNLDTLGLEMGNKPPQALDFEEAVLGALLIEPSCVDEAMEELTPGCFYDPKHRMIYEAMVSLVNEHVALDLLTVSQKLQSQKNLEAVGGSLALASLSQKIGAAAHVEYYIKILKQKCIQRDLITAAYDILKGAYDDSENVDDLIDMSQSKVFAAIQNNVKKDVQDVGSVLKTALDELEELQGQSGISGVPSGYAVLDKYTLGWQKSNLIILGARPSVGKTAFALNVLRNAAVDNNMPVAIFSLEMSAIELVKRLMTSESGLEADKIKGGVKLVPQDWDQLEYSLKALAKAPIYIDDTPGISIMEFRTKAKRLVKSKGVRFIVVDYLQLMQGPPELRGMREQEVAAISRMLKGTAKELEIPIMALSQLSRNSVQRGNSNNRPMLSDLRESGSIEQDADIVLFVHRPDAIGLGDTVEDKEYTEIIIAKNRNGQIDTIPMKFKGSQLRFVDASESVANTFESRMNSDVPDSGYVGSANDFSDNGFS
ncbi:MAG: replicative DNA helicase [Bacteroidales bacterium]|nr:replicative DNA helicase [Bacteroidales bacterium]